MKDEVRAGNDGRKKEEMLMRREYEAGNSLKKIIGRLPGRWHPGQRLHQGTMSEAWLLCGEGVSWKLVLKMAADEKSAWALRREIHFLRQLRGEGIPFLYHYGTAEDLPGCGMDGGVFCYETVSVGSCFGMDGSAPDDRMAGGMLYHETVSVMPWYTMPFYDGETLRERLDGCHSLTERETAWIGRRLCKI
ncbi:MAG: hypothetical protein LUE87_02755, partial [Lachnospiraceae bacterium]|nr:hypothetical protein [Lachnospiraceae bacterium]